MVRPSLVRGPSGAGKDVLCELLAQRLAQQVDLVLQRQRREVSQLFIDRLEQEIGDGIESLEAA